MKLKNSGGWPPNKYKHIKGSGYGTTWSSSAKAMKGQNEYGTVVSNRSNTYRVSRMTSRSPSESKENKSMQEDVNVQNYVIRLKSTDCIFYF